MNNENRFKQSMAALVAVYNNQLSPELIKVYWQALKSVNPDHLDKAVQAHISDVDNGQWFPKPAQLKKHIAQYVSVDKTRQEIVKASHRIQKAPPTDEQKQIAMDAIKEMKNGL